MPGSRDEDLDWLYGRARTSNDPEPTQVLPPLDASGNPSAPPRPAPSRSTPTYAAAPQAAPRPAPQPAPRPAPQPVQPPPGPPEGPIPDEAGGRPPRRRRPVRRVLRIVLAVVIAWVVFLVAVPVYAWSQVNRVADTPAGDRPAQQPGTLFLLVGSDSREGLSAAERKKLGTGNAAGQRTDTLMMLYVPPGGEPALISIPRDSYVAIPGNGKNKINAAFAFGGAKLLEQTVEQNTGLRIDGYVEVGFGGFVNVIDGLGGIEMCLPKAMKDSKAHINLKKGCQTLNGTNALGYVRARYSDPEGDLGRVKRQRAMLSAMVAKAASPATVLNPVRYFNVTTSGAESITLGDDTSALEMVTFVNAMRKVSGGKGLTMTVPVGNTNLSTSAGSAVAWDETDSKAMFADIARGDTSDLKQYAK